MAQPTIDIFIKIMSYCCKYIHFFICNNIFHNYFFKIKMKLNH